MKPMKSLALLIGFWVFSPLPAAAETADPATSLYQRASKLIANGETDAALEKLNTLANKYRRTELCAQALWDIYHLQQKQGDDFTAFEALNRLCTEQPGHFEKAHTAQFTLVQQLIRRTRQQQRQIEPVKKQEKIAPEVLIQMLRTIQQNGPESDIGIRAGYELARALEREHKDTEAYQLHETLAEQHSEHELADDAAYQCAYIRYKEWKKKQSGSPRQRHTAATALSWFITQYPESEHASQARGCLTQIRHSEFKELVQLAAFYEARQQPQAANIYYRQLGEDFPQTTAADPELSAKVQAALPASKPQSQPKTAVAAKLKQR
jgi:outer membrane protein assembly factor BamD (BamD/ComL family)